MPSFRKGGQSYGNHVGDGSSAQHLARFVITMAVFWRAVRSIISVVFCSASQTGDSERVAEDWRTSGSRLAAELADLLCVLWPAGLGGDDRFSDLGTALRAVYENAAKTFGARMQ